MVSLFKHVRVSKTLLWLFSLFLATYGEVLAETPRFRSKKDHFSVQPPDFFNKPKVHKERDVRNLLVTMIDDMGTLFRIEQVSVDTAIPNCPVFVVLSGFLQCGLDAIKSVFPKATIVEQEMVILNDEKLALFSLFNLPTGSLLTESKTGSKFDSMRGSIFFLEGNKCIILSYQTDLSFIPDFPISPDPKEIYKRYRSHLIDAANSFKVE